jgi:hypothetical protein
MDYMGEAKAKSITQMGKLLQAKRTLNFLTVETLVSTVRNVITLRKGVCRCEPQAKQSPV